jgi:glyoxylase-like metal-dependent hydrolase (beta-lactamase superfamily II)
MHRERVTEDVYVFTSGLYAEVSATVVVTPKGAVIVDTLPFPQETRRVREFALEQSPTVRYVVLTHHHADHIYGAYLFPEAELVSHRGTREILLKIGAESLAQAKAQTPALADVELRIPQLTFEADLLLRVGDKTIEMMYAPGHVEDGIMVHLTEDKVLVAGDVITPVPLLVRGDREGLIKSLKKIKTLNLENVIQGHGGVLLRGEIDDTVDSNIAYIRCVEKKARSAIDKGEPRSSLREIDIEECGKSRIPLGGLVQRLHVANMEFVYDEMVRESR